MKRLCNNKLSSKRNNRLKQSSSSRKQKNSPQSAVIRPFRTAIRAAAAAAVNGSDISVNAWLSLRLRAIHDDGSNH